MDTNCDRAEISYHKMTALIHFLEKGPSLKATNASVFKK